MPLSAKYLPDAPYVGKVLRQLYKNAIYVASTKGNKLRNQQPKSTNHHSLRKC